MRNCERNIGGGPRLAGQLRALLLCCTFGTVVGIAGCAADAPSRGTVSPSKGPQPVLGRAANSAGLASPKGWEMEASDSDPKRPARVTSINAPLWFVERGGFEVYPANAPPLAGQVPPEHRDSPLRDYVLTHSFGVEPGTVGADIGCGSGAFTFLLAEAAGPTGTVFASRRRPLCLSSLDLEERISAQPAGVRTRPTSHLRGAGRRA